MTFTLGDIAELIAALAAVVAAVVSVINMRKINHVGETTNSKMDRLLAVTEKEAYAAGKKDVLNGQAAQAAGETQ